MQDYKKYYNPSTALMSPNECGLTYPYEFSFVDNINDVSQESFSNFSYIIQIRSFEADWNNNTNIASYLRSQYTGAQSTTSAWINHSETITTIDAPNNIITVKVPEVVNFNGNYNCQWRWGKVGALETPVNAYSGSSAYARYLFTGDNISALNNYEFIYLHDYGSSTYYYGYVSKITPTSCLIYKYIDGAINLAKPTDATNYTTRTWWVGSYTFSNWVNFTLQKFLASGSSTSEMYIGTTANASKSSVITINNVIQKFYAIFPDSTISTYGKPMVDYYQFFVFSDASKKTLVYEGEKKYDQNLCDSVTGLSITEADYYVQAAISIDSVIYYTNLQYAQTNFSTWKISSWGATVSYDCGKDYIKIDFPSWRSYVNGDSPIYLFGRDVKDGIFNVVHTFYRTNSSETGTVYDFDVRNGHAYEYYIVNIGYNSSNWYQPLNTTAISVKFFSFFIDDVEKHISFGFKKFMSDGSVTIADNMSEIQTNLRYNSYNIGYTKEPSGNFTGLIASDTTIESKNWVSSFTDLASSNREIIFKTLKGDTYKVFLTSVSISPIQADVDNQPRTVSFSWIAI